MYRRSSVLTTRRRVMALLAALGAGAAMLTAGPAAPAHAASVVHTTPPALTATNTVTLHAYPPAATSGGITPAANLEGITCIVGQDLHIVGEARSSGIMALASTECRFNFSGGPASVPRIEQSLFLLLDGTVISNGQHVATNSSAACCAFAAADLCLHGNWINQVTVNTIFPPGYTPPTISVTFTKSKTVNNGDCPQDLIIVPNVINGKTVAQATMSLRSAGLAPVTLPGIKTCDEPLEIIIKQSPAAGTVALRGSRVNITPSAGPPTSLPCP